MNEKAQEKVAVQVGHTDHTRAFFGEVVRFDGELVGGFEEFPEFDDGSFGEARHTLYRCPGGFRRYTEVEGPETDHYLEPEEGPAFTEDKARERWPRLFSAAGLPPVRGIEVAS